MKNNNGFTLVEVVSVIVLLGLIIGITVPSVMTASTNVKRKTLQTKVDNIEQAAILYGQNNRENFNTSCSLCSGITDCFCYDEVIEVGDLVDDYIKYDEGTTDVLNSVDETKSILGCEIQIYKKYNKIYAVYLAKDTEDTTCWYK